MPIDYPVGVRTRICSALQAGCYCITSPLVLENMPELKERSFIDFSGPSGFCLPALEKYKKISDKEERRRDAHQFYHDYYSPEVASSSILCKLMSRSKEKRI